MHATEQDQHRLPARRPLAGLEQPTVDDAGDRCAHFVAVDVNLQVVAPGFGLVQRLFGLRQFLNGRSCQQLLQLRSSHVEIGLRSIERGLCAVKQVRRGKLLLANFLRALVVGGAKFEIPDCAVDICTRGGNLLLARTANKLVETRLSLREGCCSLRQSCHRACRVLAQQELSRDDGLTFGYVYPDDRFTRFRRQLDAVGREVANDPP